MEQEVSDLGDHDLRRSLMFYRMSSLRVVLLL